MKKNSEIKTSSSIEKFSTKKHLLTAFFFICIFFSMFFSACNKPTTIYFTSSEYYIFLDQQPKITPDVVCKPTGQDYSLTSSNASILTVSVDGKSVTGLREGSTLLKAESGSFNATTRVLVFKSANSDVISSTIDDKLSVYFITEAGSFAAQKLNPGEKAIDPSDQYHRGGYTLFGWYEDIEYTKKFDFDNTPISKTISLYALWGIDSPEFKFTTIEGNVYVNGLFHRYLPYQNITFPSQDLTGNLVYGITDYAFSENQNVINVSIPSGYEKIGKGAFSQCSKLETVIIGDGVIDIEEEAFYKDVSLKEVTISGNSLEQIKNKAFEGCALLSTLSLPTSLVQIGSSAFKECASLESFETPESLLKIYNEAFMSAGLTSINLKNVEEIGTQAFWDCKDLATVSGGGQLRDLGSYIFGSYISNYQSSATKWLREMVTNDNEVKESKLLYIGDALIYAYPGQLKPEYKVKETTKVIAGECFSDASNSTIIFKGFIPPASVGRYAFGGNTTNNACQSDIIVPVSVMETYINAFLVISNVPGVGLLPTEYSFSVVKRIYEKWVSQDPALQLYTRMPIDWLDSEVGTWGFSTTDTNVYMLIDGYDKTIASTMPKILNVKAETDRAANSHTYVIDRVKSYAFNADTNVEEIIMPIYITNIEEYAFMGLTNCKKISFKGGLIWDKKTSIEKYSFNFSQMPNCKIYVPADKLPEYKTIWNYSTIVDRIYPE